ncbi:MAG: ROK family protein [Bacteroidota bacterium]
MSKQVAVGIDFGGTNIKAGLVDADGAILCDARVRTQAKQGADHVLGRLAEAIEQVAQHCPGGSRICGVGIGAPGKVSLDQTTLIKPPNFSGWDEVNLSEALADVARGPVVVENDANCAGLGSASWGAGRDFDSFVMVTLGTGVGGAIIHENKLFRGATGGAGELGHMSIDYEGPYDRSGVAGAAEAYLGLNYLSHHARYQLHTRPSVLHAWAGRDLGRLSPKMLHQAAEQGDEPAREVLAWAGHKLGCVLASVVNLLDIRKLVVGGGVSAAGDYLLGPARLALQGAVMPSFAEGLELVRETRGNEVGILGAARLAFEAAAEGG